MRTSSRIQCRRRAAVLYVTTVSLSILIAGMGLSLIAAQRGDRLVQNNVALENQARWSARSGMELACVYMEQVSDWRSRVTGNLLFENVSVGSKSTCKVQVCDDADNNVANDSSTPVRVVASGIVPVAGGVDSVFRLQSAFGPRPHPALSYAAFGTTADDMEFRGTCTIRGPVRSQGDIRADWTVRTQAGASFETTTGHLIDNPLTPKTFAASAIAAPQVNLSTYLAMATPITGSNGFICQLKGCNLTPTNNPCGIANSRGIYSLDAGGREVIIENSHVQGTLIITNTGNRGVRFQRGGWIEPGPLRYPVLMVDTNNAAQLELALDQPTLPETGIQLLIGVNGIELTGTAVDFNGDGDKLDTFTTSVRGLVWANATWIYLGGAAWPFTGCVVNRHIYADTGVMINDDPSLKNVLIPGFLGTGMRLIGGTHREAGDYAP